MTILTPGKRSAMPSSMGICCGHGKGGKDREVPLSPNCWSSFGLYYHSLKRRNGWMFFSLQAPPRGADHAKAVWHACREAA